MVVAGYFALWSHDQDAHCWSMSEPSPRHMGAERWMVGGGYWSDVDIVWSKTMSNNNMQVFKLVSLELLSS